MKLRSIIGLLMLAAATWASAQTTIYVAPDGDDARNGRGSWTNAVKTISYGVALAKAGELVLVSNGTYDTVATIRINRAITLRGLDRETTIIKGNYPNTTHQGIFIANSGATVEHITVTACGSTDAEGGGVRMNGGVLNDCVVTGNMAKCGGGVYVINNGLLTECQILNNSSYADDGGGVYVISCSGVVLSNCLIAANEVAPVAPRYGGGLALLGGAPVLVGCVISNNTAPSIGGGICISSDGSPVMRDCRIVENTGKTYGGGVVLSRNCTALLTNCLVADNTLIAGGTGYGSGINSGSYTNTALTMLWCRVTGNTAAQAGAGIFMGNGLLDHCVITDNLLTNGTLQYGAGIYIHSNATAEVRNCLIAGNTSGQGSGGGSMGIDQNTTSTVVNCTIVSNYSYLNCGGVYFYSANDADRFYNCVIASNTVGATPSCGTKNLYLRTAAQSNAFYYSCGDLLTNTAQGNITNDPCLVNLAGGDYRLAQGSPCINTGTNLPWMAEDVDLDGRIRIDRFSRLVDMGCYEHVPQGMIFNLR